MFENDKTNDDINQSNQLQAGSDEKNPLDELARVVNLTRLNRIHASNRLLATEQFVQHTNIYYSCVAAAITIFSLIYENSSFSIASAIMTVALAISIVYLNAQKYGSRAQQLQMNYLALHQLLFDIENAKRNNDLSNIETYQKRYVQLLQTSENHIDHDYRKTAWKSDRKNKYKVDYKPKLTGIEKYEYIGLEVLRNIIKVFFWSLPVVYFILVSLKKL